MYFPTAANKAKPDNETDLVMSLRTPKGAMEMIMLVIFIIVSKHALKKFLNSSECFESMRVMPMPMNMAKNMMPSMSPEEAALKGFKGIILINMSAGDPGFCKLELSNPFEKPISAPIPG